MNHPTNLTKDNQIVPWLLRLLNEYAELKEKTQLLGKSIAANAHQHLGEHKPLLEQQYTHMQDYLNVLATRVSISLTPAIYELYLPKSGPRCQTCKHGLNTPQAKVCPCLGNNHSNENQFRIHYTVVSILQEFQTK